MRSQVDDGGPRGILWEFRKLKNIKDILELQIVIVC